MFKQVKRTEDFSKYKRVHNRTLGKLCLAKRWYLLQLSPKDLKRFWKAMKFLNRKMKSVLTLNNSSDVACTSTDKANNMLNIYYIFLQTALPPLSPHCLHLLPNHNQIPVKYYALRMPPSCYLRCF